MSIKQKLFTSFGIIIVVLFALTYYASSQLTNVNDSYMFLLQDRVYKVLEANEIESAVTRQGAYIRSYVLRQNEQDLDNLETQFNKIDEQISLLDTLFTDDVMFEQLDEIKKQQQLFEQYAQQIIAAMDADDEAKAQNILFTNAAPTNLLMIDAVDEIIAFQTEQLEKTSIATTDEAKLSKLLVNIVSVASMITVVILVVRLTLSIVRPLTNLTNAAEIIATGDLRQQDIEVHSKDEIFKLATAFNKMKNNLADLIAHVATNIAHTTTSTEELVASTDSIASVTKDVATRVEQISVEGNQTASIGIDCASATEESANRVTQIAEVAQQLQSDAQHMQHMTIKGSETLQTTEVQMNVIQKSSHETREKIRQLSGQSAEIENITRVITQITEQTNLLALNAAIEAARAGEYGKGFAVVADEVRKLAEESKHSASQIVTLTNSIQQDTKEVERSVDITVKNIDEGVMYVQHAQTSFETIAHSITEMNSKIQHVSAASEEISTTTEQVAVSVKDMAQALSASAEDSATVLASTEEQMATMEEINAVAKTLSEDAMALQEEVNRFKV